MSNELTNAIINRLKRAVEVNEPTQIGTCSADEIIKTVIEVLKTELTK